MATNFIQKACEILKRAIQADNDENYETAVSLYSQGIQYLMTGLKYEKNRKVKDAIKDKVQKYLTRAEEIQSTLLSSTNKTKKRKKKKLHKYPTQQEITDAINNADEDTIHLIHGYSRSIEKLLNINYCIPEGIIKLCLAYYYIPIENPLEQQIVFEKPNIKWEDVAGLNHAKQKLKEFVILPLKFPTLFASRGNNKPTTILLYGPPGTGKTFLSKAIATEANNATFISLSSCDLCCRYYVNPHKSIRNAFAMARKNKPTILCFDEIDSLCPRATTLDQNPSRIMTEFLAQLHGVSDSKIVVIGTTNCPWELSVVARREFIKRIYVPLPDDEARRCIFRTHVGASSNNLSQQDYVTLGQMSEGFSGSDISGIVQDALMEPVREMQNATHFKRVVDENNGSDYKLVPCNGNDNGAIQMSLLNIPESEQINVRAEPLEIRHFLRVLQFCRASVDTEDIQRHINWRNEFGEEE
eukprot:140741_1